MNKLKNICKECGKEFLVRSYQLKIGTGLYCSHKCAAKNQKVETLEIRFWKMVNKKADNECWEFTGCKNKDGYGKISKGNSKLESAHRISYELHKGKIPDNMVVMHTCDNPACCNPDHLILGTQNDNIQDMVNKKRNVIRTGIRMPKELVEDIKNNYKGQKGFKIEMAKKYKCSPSTITNIIGKVISVEL